MCYAPSTIYYPLSHILYQFKFLNTFQRQPVFVFVHGTAMQVEKGAIIALCHHDAYFTILALFWLGMDAYNNISLPLLSSDSYSDIGDTHLYHISDSKIK